MDFNTITSKQYELKIKSPVDGEFSGLTVNLISLNEDGPKQLSEEHAERKSEAIANGRPLSQKAQQEHAKDLFAACVVSWEWGEAADGKMASIGGETPECTPENVKMMLEKFPWFYSQVFTAARKEANFYQVSGAKSPKK
jgi:hypothetical protein